MLKPQLLLPVCQALCRALVCKDAEDKVPVPTQIQTSAHMSLVTQSLALHHSCLSSGPWESIPIHCVLHHLSQNQEFLSFVKRFR